MFPFKLRGMYFHSLMQRLHVSVSMYMSAASAGVLKVVNNRLFTSTMIIVQASILDKRGPIVFAQLQSFPEKHMRLSS